MKTPEEIKKGMECCAGMCEGHICTECPRKIYSLVEVATAQPMKDAIAYIQQLESRLEQVERENKAMLHDMARYTMCGSCKHFADDGKCPQKDECVYGEIGRFEWRGVCEENTKEE